MNRLYVLVRKDLGSPYKFVQGGHAIAEWVLKNPESWQNETLIMLEVNDEFSLKKWKSKLESKNIKHVIFQEPDIDMQTTSLAVLSNGEMFKRLKLA